MMATLFIRLLLLTAFGLLMTVLGQSEDAYPEFPNMPKKCVDKFFHHVMRGCQMVTDGAATALDSCCEEKGLSMPCLTEAMARKGDVTACLGRSEVEQEDEAFIGAARDQCLVECMWRRMGLMAEDGSIVGDSVRQDMAQRFFGGEMGQSDWDGVQNCIDTTPKDPSDTRGEACQLAEIGLMCCTDAVAERNEKCISDACQAIVDLPDLGDSLPEGFTFPGGFTPPSFDSVSLPDGIPEGLPEGVTVPDLPEGVPEVPEGLPEVPEVPEGLPEVPEVPEGLPEVPEVPEGIPEVPAVPDVPEVPLPDASNLPEVPNPPDVPQVPDVPQPDLPDPPASLPKVG